MVSQKIFRHTSNRTNYLPLIVSRIKCLSYQAYFAFENVDWLKNLAKDVLIF